MNIIINNKEFTLENFLYVLDISKNLVRLLDLWTTPITITRQEDKSILTKENKNLMTGDFNCFMIVTFNQPASNLTAAQQNWHLQLGHPSNKTLKFLSLNPIKKEQCDTYARAKMTLH
ncbi:hypothetical protein O181_092434 [Austropuccinia psidii MF-1]|uniref:GAG-pre-integrase domain-containing protein n=1 Tax=Austropuccinia psidii MF-1 TaxID=1389203 RepID=A0A9Q3IZ91_9BASI|nr:hypothetical protein [Austropuccinia psidii MF-1]